MIQHRFPQNDPVPLFLAGPAKEADLSAVRKFLSSKRLKKAALVLAAVAFVYGAVSAWNAFVSVSGTASPVSAAAPADAVAQSAPVVQSSAGVEAAPESQLGDELAAVIKSAGENKAEADRAKADALFNQFQTWAAEADAQSLPAAQVQAAPQQQQIEEAQADVVRSPPLPRRRPVHLVHAARSPDATPQTAPSFMQRFGFRN